MANKNMINCKGRLIEFEAPSIMGILNLTPDSFYDGGKYNSFKNSLKQIEKMLTEGVDIVDIGAVSTRPYADEVSEEDEIKRLLPLLKEARKKFPECIISVDTFRSNTARQAIEEGADIINDVYGGAYDPAIWDVAAHYKTPYILMHMRGTPASMQKNTSYDNVVNDILYYMSENILKLKAAGVNDIIIDPGIGFGKSLAQNYTLLKNLDFFTALGYPVLIGLSRKSLICKALGVSPEDSLNGTSILHALIMHKHPSIIRVHDVKEAVEVRSLYKLFRS